MSSYYPVRMGKAFAIFEVFDEASPVKLPGHKVVVWTNNPEVADSHLSKINLTSMPWYKCPSFSTAQARVLAWVREERAFAERALEGRRDVVRDAQRDIETFEKELLAYTRVETELAPSEDT